jgi:hypothetical protein
MSAVELYLRLAFATGLVLSPGWLLSRAIGLRGVAAALAWSLTLLFASLVVVFLLSSTLTTAIALFAIAGLAPRRLWLLRSLAWRVAGLARKEPLFRHVFPWALEQAKQRYAAPAMDAVDRARTDAAAALRRAGV